ncbi:NepR family anti-sigma factor [Yoonia litorea]|uniref:Anti-sigma factor NepR domain-containing protein n=1 Tax=Yoonia litorea TaxID=1123755 RepID=A0A1I6LNE7_9RHOB|nr:NepR family anti-sigma factor [Yoonia litorea]SFS05047.1 hypothetical protein SAMN05444714_0742 [Yoonia litorea]
MTDEKSEEQERIDNFIDANLKKVFADLEKDDIPDEITDLLTLLRAQDAELKSKE